MIAVLSFVCAEIFAWFDELALFAADLGSASGGRMIAARHARVRSVHTAAIGHLSLNQLLLAPGELVKLLPFAPHFAPVPARSQQLAHTAGSEASHLMGVEFMAALFLVSQTLRENQSEIRK